MLLAMVVMEDREADEELLEEMDDSPHARQLVGEEMVDV